MLQYFYETTELEFPCSDEDLTVHSPGPEWRLHSVEHMQTYDCNRIFAIWEKVVDMTPELEYVQLVDGVELAKLDLPDDDSQEGLIQW